jgi:hypothetical protein
LAGQAGPNCTCRGAACCSAQPEIGWQAQHMRRCSSSQQLERHRPGACAQPISPLLSRRAEPQGSFLQARPLPPNQHCQNEMWRRWHVESPGRASESHEVHTTYTQVTHYEIQHPDGGRTATNRRPKQAGAPPGNPAGRPRRPPRYSPLRSHGARTLPRCQLVAPLHTTLTPAPNNTMRRVDQGSCATQPKAAVQHSRSRRQRQQVQLPDPAPPFATPRTGTPWRVTPGRRCDVGGGEGNKHGSARCRRRRDFAWRLLHQTPGPARLCMRGLRSRERQH